jgi:hypothetical protein
VAGRSVTAAAESAGVGRSTVYGWLKHCFPFAAELARRKREVRDSAHGRLMDLAGKAIECAGKAIDGGNVQAALTLLRGLGLLTGEPADYGPDDPEQLEIDAAAARQQKVWERIEHDC